MNSLAPLKKIIEKYGWIQQSNGNAYRGFCLMGALRFYLFLPVHCSVKDSGLYTEIQRRIDSLHPHVSLNPVQWNDSAGRTYEEVIALLSMDDIISINFIRESDA